MTLLIKSALWNDWTGLTAYIITIILITCQSYLAIIKKRDHLVFHSFSFGNDSLSLTFSNTSSFWWILSQIKSWFMTYITENGPLPMERMTELASLAWLLNKNQRNLIFILNSFILVLWVWTHTDMEWPASMSGDRTHNVLAVKQQC